MADNNNNNNKNINLAQLRATLESLQEIDLSIKVGSSSTATTTTSPTSATQSPVIDSALVERYEQARDRYLNYLLGHNFYEKLVHGGSTNEWSLEDDDEDEEDAQQRQQAAKERLDQFRNQALQRLQALQEQRLQVERDYAAFCERRDKLADTVRELEANETDDDDLEDGELEDVDEEALALEEEKVKQLTKQKEEMQAQLQALQEETKRLQAEEMQSQTKLRGLLRKRGAKPADDDAMMVDDDVDTNEVLDEQQQQQYLAAVEAENQDLQRQLQQLKETSSLNDDMIAAFEHFGGIKIVSVVEVNNTETNCGKDMVMTLELLHDRRYTMQLTLRPQPDNIKIYQVFHATFTASATEDAPTITLPDLEELVQYARTLQTMEVKEQLKFVVREAMMQIRVREARATELAILFAEFPQVDEAFQPSEERPPPPALLDGWQEVTCRVYGTVVATLRLSPDCPVVKGSVFLDRLTGLEETGDKDDTDDVVEHIKLMVNRQQKFSSPVPLLQKVREELVARNNTGTP